MKRGWIALLAATGLIRLLTQTGGDTWAVRAHDVLTGPQLAAAALTLELGAPQPWEAETKEALSPQLTEEETPPPAAPEERTGPEAAPDADAGRDEAKESAPEATGEAVEGPAASPPAAPEPETAVFSPETLVNRTGYEVDVEALRAEPVDVHLPSSGPQILIIHTHGTEAYTPDSFHMYTATDAYRTTDTDFNVIHVGDVLAEELAGQGFRVIHDRELYDYPSYTGSYTRSAAAVESWLAQYPQIAVVIDLHRDALGSGDVIYKTRAEVSDETSAQVMLLVGTGENGLEHPRWQENFKLALRMQDAMALRYPTLARPIDLVSERYNQQYTTGSLLVEVGSSGNTLPEAVCAIRLFARAVGPVLAALEEPV